MAKNYSTKSIYYDFRSKYINEINNINYGIEIVFGRKNLRFFKE